MGMVPRPQRKAGLAWDPAPTVWPDKLQGLGLGLQGGPVRSQFLSSPGLPDTRTRWACLPLELLATFLERGMVPPFPTQPAF